MTNRAIGKAALVTVLVAAGTLMQGCMDYRASLALAPMPVAVQSASPRLSINEVQTVLVCDGTARSELNRCRQLDINRVRESLQYLHRDPGY